MEAVNHGLGLKQRTGVSVIDGTTIHNYIDNELLSSHILKAIHATETGSGSHTLALDDSAENNGDLEGSDGGFSQSLSAVLQAASTQPLSVTGSAGFSQTLVGVLGAISVQPVSASHDFQISDDHEGSQTVESAPKKTVTSTLGIAQTATPDFAPLGASGFSHSVGVEVTGDRPLGDKVVFGQYIGGYIKSGDKYIAITDVYDDPVTSEVHQLSLKNLTTLDEVILRSPQLGNSREYDLGALERRGKYHQVNKTSRSSSRPILLSQTFEIYLKPDTVDAFIAFELNNRGKTLQLTDHLSQVWLGMMRLQPISELKNWTIITFEFVGKAVTL